MKTLAEIFEAWKKCTGCNKDDLLVKMPNRALSARQQLFTYMVYQNTAETLSSIGRFIDKTHVTVRRQRLEYIKFLSMNDELYVQLRNSMIETLKELEK